ncbi:MAG: hypothetical protein PVJ76_02525 [Gemmatimonadota bacterium]|jgi:hypothetical protein
MKKLSYILGIVFLGLGVFILVFAGGLRRWYSGFFFILIGAVWILTARVRKGDSE